MGQAGCGERAPREHYRRQKYCPVCKDLFKIEIALDSRHVVLFCDGVSSLRARLGIGAFARQCHALGLGTDAVFSLYVNGFAPDHSRVPQDEHRGRGAAMKEIKEKWLELW
jgi:hypothetical protein